MRLPIKEKLAPPNNRAAPPSGWRPAVVGMGCGLLMSMLASSASGMMGGMASTGAGASPRSEIKEQHSELRGRIDAMRRELANSEETRAYAADQLRETESAISDVNRDLRQLAEQRSALQTEAKDLARQSEQLSRQTETQQAQLSRLLQRQLMFGEADALRQLLAGDDPNQRAVDAYLLQCLSQAQAEFIASLRDAAKAKNALTRAAKAKSSELIAVEQQQRQAKGTLLAQQKQRQVLLTSVAEKIRSQRREIGALQKDEKRLSRLLEGLTRIVARPVRESPSAPDNSPTSPASPTPPPQLPQPPQPDVANSGDTAVKPVEPVKPSKPPREKPVAEFQGAAFGSLKGRLRMPVRGEVGNQFGQSRSEGGTTWKGIFIRAAEGAEVSAVAAGQVVFADWLRGFGNLLVLDHGDGYLSVYGNNQSLLKETGQTVKTGDIIATVGNSGGNPDSGLYFEIRHQGQAFDPLRWVGRR